MIVSKDIPGIPLLNYFKKDTLHSRSVRWTILLVNELFDAVEIFSPYNGKGRALGLVFLGDMIYTMNEIKEKMGW